MAFFLGLGALFDFFGATLIVDGPDTVGVTPLAGVAVAPRVLSGGDEREDEGESGLAADGSGVHACSDAVRRDTAATLTSKGGATRRRVSRFVHEHVMRPAYSPPTPKFRGIRTNQRMT